ncbi:MAG TPA: LptF/LptG family permease [Gemmatimonadaceae bacterium]|nr:LptF/LptG family permease [Gemmatimonadaceae bacterium]
MKILNRYVLREHAGPLTFALAALTSLLLLNYIAKNIGQLVGKGLPWTVITEFILLSLPLTVALTVPMAVLIAVLYAFSRLASENEITALKASGVSVGRVLIPVVIASCGIMFAMVAFNDQVLPRSNHRLRTLQSDIARKKPTFALRPRVINEVSPGKLFLAAAHIDQATSRLREVTIYDLGDPTRNRTIYADSGLMALSPVSGELELTLFDGSMNEVQKATPEELQRMFYRVDLIRIKGVGDQLTRSTNDDFKSDREMTICELQSNVAAGEDAQGRAVAEVRRFMVDGARVAATGAAPNHGPGPTKAPPSRSGLGRVYCDGLDAVDRFFARFGHPKGGGAGAPATPLAQPAQAIAAAKPVPASSGMVPPSAGMRPLPPSAGGPVVLPSPPPPRVLPPPRTVQPRVLPPPRVPPRVLPPPRVFPRPQVPQVPAPVYRPPSQATLALSTLSSTIEATRAEVDNGVRSVNLYDNQIHKLFAIAVACVIFVFLGAPIALRFPRGGVGMVLGVSLAAFAIYYIGLIAGEPLAQRGTLSPFLAMWASNIVFGIVGVFLLSRLGRESSTSRGGYWSELKDAIRRRLAKLRTGRRRNTAFSTESA